MSTANPQSPAIANMGVQFLQFVLAPPITRQPFRCLSTLSANQDRLPRTYLVRTFEKRFREPYNEGVRTRRRDFLAAGATIASIGGVSRASGQPGGDMYGLIGKMTTAPGK